VEYTQELIARSRESVPAIWNAYAQMAVRMQGGAAIMISGLSPGEPSVVATAGIAEAAKAVRVTWPELDALIRDGSSRPDVPVAEFGPIRHQLADLADAR